MKFFQKFFEVILAPIYKLTFVAYVLTAFVLWLVSYGVAHIPQVYDLLSSLVAVLTDTQNTQISIDKRFTLALLSTVALSPVAFYFLGRRISARYRTGIDIFRTCLVSHEEFMHNASNIIADENQTKAQKQTQISFLARQYSIFLCSRAAEIFTNMTGCECHVAIKTLDASTGQIKTRTRDGFTSSRIRESSDEHLNWFDYKTNTAFTKILDDNNYEMYCSNWLKILSMVGAYSNANPQWKNLYCATIVVPITRLTHPAEIRPETVQGFICVDNKKGRFRKSSGYSVLSLFVVLIGDYHLDKPRSTYRG